MKLSKIKAFTNYEGISAMITILSNPLSCSRLFLVELHNLPGFYIDPL